MTKQRMINQAYSLLYYVDPKAQAPTIPDPDVATDVPCIMIEEMLQDLTISDDRSHDSHVLAGADHQVDSSGDVVMGTE